LFFDIFVGLSKRSFRQPGDVNGDSDSEEQASSKEDVLRGAHRLITASERQLANMA